MAALPFISSVAKRLEGKVAIITGGASGIGEITAKVFASQGANVVVADIQDERGRFVSNAISEMTPSTYVHCDVTNEDQVKSAVAKAVSTYGKLDIMFNNAGIMDVPNKPRIIDHKKSDFERVLSVNITGVFLGIKHASQAMIPARSGCIISTTSIASTVAAAATYGYTCSKHAVVGLTKNAAVEFGRFGIRVNSIGPYGCGTPLATSFLTMSEEEVENMCRSAANLKGMTLKAEDIANAALFLASEEGRYISGHNLLVDGGFSIFNPNMNIFSDIDA